MTRTCEMYALSDCQTANGIKYCYCNTDRCNNVEQSIVPVGVRNKPISDNTDIISDDEDDSEYGDDDDSIEASGSGSLITTLSTSTTSYTSTFLQSLTTTKEKTNPITFETTTRLTTSTMPTDENNFLTTISPKMNFKNNSSPVTLSTVYLILGTFVMIIF